MNAPVLHAAVGKEIDLHGILPVCVSPPTMVLACVLFISLPFLLCQPVQHARNFPNIHVPKIESAERGRRRYGAECPRVCILETRGRRFVKLEHAPFPIVRAKRDVWVLARAGFAKGVRPALGNRASTARPPWRLWFRFPRKARKRARTDVQIDNTVSRQFTVIDVYASDRPGVLFGVADAIYRLGLTIHLAKINTYVNQVLDVFYVTDANGSKVPEGQGLARVRDAILDRIREPADEAPVAAVGGAAR